MSNPFNPLFFLEVARELANIEREALARTSISRSYYAAFLLSREILSSYGRQVKTGKPKDHELVITEFRKLGRRDIGDKLDSLRKMRNEADYELDKLITRRHALRALNLADEVVMKIQRFKLR